jgi:rhodanese-related sulfurtransferase
MHCSTHLRAQRTIRLATALVAGLSVWSTAWSISASAQQQVQPTALQKFLAGRLGPVLDVRAPGDCDDNLALRRSAVRIPYDGYDTSGDARSMADDAFLDRVAGSPSLAPARRQRGVILVVCCGGSRSEQAAKFLMSKGYRTATLVAGLANQQIPRRVMKRQ